MQDAAGFGGQAGVPGAVLAAAVADGHGHRRHFRSDRGSTLAVSVALSCARELGAELVGAGHEVAVTNVEQLVRRGLGTGLVGRWRDEVLADADRRPFSPEEQRRIAADDEVTPYGSTLLVALVADPFIVLGQIGDGDAVVVFDDDAVAVPIPVDERNDGWRTTSLCQPDAVQALRVAVLDQRVRPVSTVLLATDGLGNAQSVEPWQEPVTRDLTWLLRRNGVEWMRRELPLWVARCASGEGSGDDAAVALLFSGPER